MKDSVRVIGRIFFSMNVELSRGLIPVGRVNAKEKKIRWFLKKKADFENFVALHTAYYLTLETSLSGDGSDLQSQFVWQYLF